MEIDINSARLEIIFQYLAIGASLLGVVLTLVTGLRSGYLRSIRLGSLEIEGGFSKEDIRRLEIETSGENKPFEIEALASYYNQALARANISFWFSLVFASFGFGLIVIAFFSHADGDVAGTVVKVLSGSVVEAVSALFFVQSTNAQKSMGEFFEKLRLDRLNAEAREMISEIENVERRDQLRAQIILKYSGIDKLLEGGGH